MLKHQQILLSAYQIEARHTFLETLLGKVKAKETESLETARTLVITITHASVSSP